MASGGDIIRITDVQEIYGQEALNVYFYQLNEDGTFLAGYLDDIASHFVEAVVTPVVALQSADITHTRLYLENLTNGVDILTYTDGYPLPGAQELSSLPPFVTATFQLVREERTTRNGSKRIGGVCEADVTSGVWTGSSTLLTDIENGMKADIVSGIATLCNPVIVRHPITVPLVSPVLAHVGDCVFKSIGSQNTRKLGRGV